MRIPQRRSTWPKNLRVRFIDDLSQTNWERLIFFKQANWFAALNSIVSNDCVDCVDCIAAVDLCVLKLNKTLTDDSTFWKIHRGPLYTRSLLWINFIPRPATAIVKWRELFHRFLPLIFAVEQWHISLRSRSDRMVTLEQSSSLAYSMNIRL